MIFEDIYGYESIKETLLQLKSYYDNKQEYDDMGADIPKGILLYGQPGCGKSLFAKEFALLIDTSPIIIKTKNEMVSSFTKTQEIASSEKKTKMILIDELDLLVHDDDETVRILQTCIDGFSSSSKVFIIATCNRIYDLPEPLVRKGRFDYKLEILKPNKEERIELLRKYFDRCGISSKGVDFAYISSITYNFSCADIKYLINTIRLRLKDKITKEGIEEIVTECGYSITKLCDKEDRSYATAIHEAGHVLLLLTYKKFFTFFRSVFLPGNTNNGATIYDENKKGFCFEESCAYIQMSLAGKIA